LLFAGSDGAYVKEGYRLATKDPGVVKWSVGFSRRTFFGEICCARALRHSWKKERVGMIKVWSYSGYRGEERPYRFELSGVMLEVEEVLDRWYGQEADFFKVRTDRGGVYILRLDRFDGCWDLESISGY